MSYDSTTDTREHIAQVQILLSEIMMELQLRATTHDRSKLVEPERSMFDRYTPLLRETTYGSAEYNAHLTGMGEALQHHYAHNRHHPEHFEDGISGMNLVDVLEMLADWKAATLRHDDGDLKQSIERNAERFGYGPEMRRLLLNTARGFGWIGSAETYEPAPVPEPDDAPVPVDDKGRADTRCQLEAMAYGSAWPRSCPTCGLGGLCVRAYRQVKVDGGFDIVDGSGAVVKSHRRGREAVSEQQAGIDAADREIKEGRE